MIKILRDDWKFAGYVTSDCGAIDDFWQRHKTSPDAESAATEALLHGTDVECGNVTYKSLVKAVQDGKLNEKEIDASVQDLHPAESSQNRDKECADHIVHQGGRQ